MQVLILAGGLGSRIRALTKDLTPKALLKVGGTSILEFQVASLPKNASVLVLIGSNQFYEEFSFEASNLRQKYGVNIDVLAEGASLGTGGALRKVSNHLDKNFIVLMGDILFSDDLDPMWHQYRKSTSDIGVVVRETNHPEDSDLVELKSNGKINTISKYPHQSLNDAGNYYGMTGIYMLSKKIVSDPAHANLKDLTKILERAVKNNWKAHPIHGIGVFRDIGTMERFSQAEEIVQEIETRRSLPLKNIILLDKDDTLMRDKNPSHPVFDSDINWNLIKKCKRNFPDSVHLIVTNQPGVAKGQFTVEELLVQLDSLKEKLAAVEFKIDDFSFCPHHPHKGYTGEIENLKINCKCRKPLPGMVVKLLNSADYRANKVILFGDSFRDKLLSDILGIEFKWAYKGSLIERIRNQFQQWVKYRKVL